MKSRLLHIASAALLTLTTPGIAAADPNGAWVLLSPSGSGPAPREGHVLIYDPVADRLILHGGYDGVKFFDDVWVFSLATNGPWQQIVPAGPAPVRRAYHAATYDALRQRVLIHGGMNPTPLDGLWALDLSGPAAWDSLAPGGTGPGARYWHSMVDDPITDRALLFAGAGASHDLFELQLGAGADGTWW